MRLVLAATALCAGAFVVVSKVEPSRTAPAPPHHVSPRPLPQTPRNRRPLQFVVVSFDGSGGIRLWPYWRSVARRAGAHFTFFVGGVYLLPERLRRRYHPPRHAPGTSDIWFARPDRRFSAAQVVRRTLAQIAAAYREGHEIGTHFNGHFCEPYPGNVDEWMAADWRHELDEFDRLLFHDRKALPFGPREIVGRGRRVCRSGRGRAGGSGSGACRSWSCRSRVTRSGSCRWTTTCSRTRPAASAALPRSSRSSSARRTRP